MIRTIIYTTLTLLLGLASVIASELILTGPILSAPWDVTGSFFLLGLIPTQLLVVGIAFALLAMVFRHHLVLLPIYIVVFCVAHAFELHALSNPPFDIFMYVAAILIASGCWLSLWWPLFLRPRT